MVSPPARLNSFGWQWARPALPSIEDTFEDKSQSAPTQREHYPQTILRGGSEHRNTFCEVSCSSFGILHSESLHPNHSRGKHQSTCTTKTRTIKQEGRRTKKTKALTSVGATDEFTHQPVTTKKQTKKSPQKAFRWAPYRALARKPYSAIRSTTRHAQAEP